MRWLQALVAVMSMMIVVSLVVIGVTIAHRLGSRGSGTHAMAISAPVNAPLLSTLKLPNGARIVSIAGAGDHVVLQLETPDHAAWLYVFDPVSGLITRRIEMDAR